MPRIIKNFLNSAKLRRATDIRTAGLYIFAIFVLAIAWSGAKTVQNNYELQKKISVLRQQNQLLNLANQNTQLQDKYYQTDQYLELAARQNFGLAAPGETVLLVPQNVAMKYVDKKLVVQSADSNAADNRSTVAKNIAAWRDFLLGRKNTN